MKSFYLLRIYDPSCPVDFLVAQIKDHFPACQCDLLPGTGTIFPVQLPAEKEGPYYLVKWFWFQVQLDWSVYAPGSTVCVTVDQYAILVALPDDKGQYVTAHLGDRLYSLERLANNQMHVIPGYKWFADIVESHQHPKPEQQAEPKQATEKGHEISVLKNEISVLKAEIEMWKEKSGEHILQNKQTTKEYLEKDRRGMETNSMMLEDWRMQDVEWQRQVRREKKKANKKGKKLDATITTCNEINEVNHHLKQRVLVLVEETNHSKKELHQVQNDLVVAQNRHLQFGSKHADLIQRYKRLSQKVKTTDDQHRKKIEDRDESIRALNKEATVLRKDKERAYKDRREAEVLLANSSETRREREKKLKYLEKENAAITKSCESLRILVGTGPGCKNKNKDILECAVSTIQETLMAIYKMTPDSMPIDRLRYLASLYYKKRPDSEKMSVGLLKACYTAIVLNYREKKEEAKKAIKRCTTMSETIRTLRVCLMDYIMNPQSKYNIKAGVAQKSELLEQCTFPKEETLRMVTIIQKHQIESGGDTFLETIVGLYRISLVEATSIIMDTTTRNRGIVKIQRWFRGYYHRRTTRISRFVLRIQRWYRWQKLMVIAEKIKSATGTLGNTTVRGKELKEYITVVNQETETADLRMYIAKRVNQQNGYRQYFDQHPTHYHAEGVMENVVEALRLSTPVIMSPVRLRTLNEEFERYAKEPFLKSKDAVRDFCDNPETSGMIQLKQFTQKGFDYQMRRFITEVHPAHPVDWKERIICGVYVPKGDIMELKTMLFESYRNGTSVLHIVPKVAKDFGVGNREAEDLVRSYITVQGYAIRELQQQGLTIKVESKPHSPVSVMVTM